jgi:hypothetical protein
VVTEVASYSKLSKNMSGENLDPLLQNPLSKAFIRSCRSEKIVLNFSINFLLIGSDTPLYYIQIINFTIYLIINLLTPLSLTAMPSKGEFNILLPGTCP